MRRATRRKISRPHRGPNPRRANRPGDRAGIRARGTRIGPLNATRAAHPTRRRACSKTSATRFTTRGSDSQKLGLGRRDSIARLRVLGTVHRPRVQSARRILSRSGFLTYISRCDGSRVRLRLRLIRRGVVEKLVHLRSDCASIEKPHELAPSCRIVSHCSSSAS